MAERLQQILKRVLDWWNKFTSRQKTIIVAIVAGVVLALVILITYLLRPQYVELFQCETTKEASGVIDMLEAAGITNYKTSTDGKVISVLKEDEANARIQAGASDIPTTGYAFENIFDGGFTTTEADKQRKTIAYQQSALGTFIKNTNANIKRATVTLYVPTNNGTLIAQEKESNASVVLELSANITQEAVMGIAELVANALGNQTTNNIVIMDDNGHLLFSGGEEYSESGTASSQLRVTQEAEYILNTGLREVLLGTNMFGSVIVKSHLLLDFSVINETVHLFTPNPGSDQGVLSERHVYQSDSTAGTGGIPGTDSNGNETSYVYSDYSDQSTSITESDEKFLPNETITSKYMPPGSVKYDESSISATLISYKVLKEEDAKAQGLLTDMTWSEYKAANSSSTTLTASDELYDLAAKASGISKDSISLMVLEENIFIDKEGIKVKTTDVAVAVLFVIILGMLGFVVLRSMRTDKVEEEEELSVETLLQSRVPEPTLEDIELDEKSQTRRLVEKFVEDNPEAVASLLRNWLTEDWR